ncbi:MAG TPA: arginyltransferase [Gammaproteobacteria bacterium]|nr:arginyltransferase [Gammaproteobacteria bacterium]
MQSNNKIISSVRLFRTSPHPCSYKDSEQAATVFVDPDLVIDKALNSKLSDLGYRRSGAHLYRPDCDFCQACISCRVPVAEFQFNRSQRRILRRNESLRMVEKSDLTDEFAYGLYQRYINQRHLDGDMFPASLEQYEAFIKTKMVDTRFFLFYEQDELLAVSVVDFLEQGLSAVYTFFDPDQSQRSLGNFAILWQIKKCQELGLPYLFLGYWIKGCGKMEYKSKFRPLEMLINGRWVLAK